MARQVKAVEVMDDSASLVFPDASEFGPVEIAAEVPHPGRVRGLDYGKWAVALIDLRSRPERIASERRRITSKGYRLLGGSPVVEGWPVAEVYVMPRELYEKKLEARRQQFVDGIDTGRYTEAVLPREVVHRGR